MNSSILKSLMLFFLSCNNHGNTTFNNRPVDTPAVASKHKEEKPKRADTSSMGFDTTINGTIVLWNSESTYSTFGNLSGKLQDYPDEGSFVIFKNKEGDKYLKMVHLPGSDPNTFRFFEVGYVKTLDTKITLLQSPIENFETESGVKLGMSISDFLKGRNTEYSKIAKGNDVTFKISETIDGLEYNGNYYFKNGQLNKFGFGYKNP